MKTRKMCVETLVAHRTYLVRTSGSKNAYTVERIISGFDEYDLWNWVDRIDVDNINHIMVIKWRGE